MFCFHDNNENDGLGAYEGANIVNSFQSFGADSIW
jgi:hypothetical protein